MQQYRARGPLPPPPPLPQPEQPLAAPRPHKIDHSIPINMARNLDDQLQQLQRQAVTSATYPNQGFPVSNHTPSSMAYPSTPPPLRSPPGPWLQPQPNNPSSYTSSPPNPYSPFPQPQYQPQQQHRQQDPLSLRNPHDDMPSSISQSPPSLTAPLPTIPNLTAALPAVQQLDYDPSVRMAWARDVIFLVDRIHSSPSTEPSPGPVRIADPQLFRLSQVAVQIVLQISSIQTPPNSIPEYIAEAIYFKALFESSGAYPDLVPKNPRGAFRDFEAAARAGFAQAWFRLGRDYENFQDFVHARDCFERGIKLNVESCCYRMGMAHLMGQLGLPASFEVALPLLHRAATLASLEVPQPAYIYALLLLNEFNTVIVPPHFFTFPPSSTPLLEARKYIERAAYLNFAPAQYKLGHAYEFAEPPFPFDALLSVQYYSLASQQGEIEADMSLSKWFLCGSEGAFEKDENLAYTFAEKAARKGLSSAEFAMGYYAEVGVGRPKDLEMARTWYTKAAQHGNADAVERLDALSQPVAQPLSRQEHDVITENKLMRKRTQARERWERGAAVAATADTGAPLRPPSGFIGEAAPSTAPHRHNIIENVRYNSLAHGREHLSSPQPQRTAVDGVRHPEARNTIPAAPTQRYSLMDPGSSRGPSPSRPAPGGLGIDPGVRRGTSPRPTSSPGPIEADTSPRPLPAMPPDGHKRPATFAEMGIQGVKAEDKDCIIM